MFFTWFQIAQTTYIIKNKQLNNKHPSKKGNLAYILGFIIEFCNFIQY